MAQDPRIRKITVSSAPKFQVGEAFPSKTGSGVPKVSLRTHSLEPKAACCHHASHEKVQPSSKAKYFCPMCPGVESETRGVCPKCGMDLERNPSWKGEDGEGEDDPTASIRHHFWIALILTIPVVALAMSHWLPGEWNVSDQVWSRWVQGILSTFIVLHAGADYLMRGWRSILNRAWNMWTLILFGVVSAWLFSMVGLLWPHWSHGLGMSGMSETHPHGQSPIYFESVAVIITLVLMGQWMETKARQRTGDSIRALMDLCPPKARRQEGGQWVEVQASDLRIGDRIQIKAGERVAADGRIVEGHASLDESMLTGEFLPVEKKQGEELKAGTMLTSGVVEMAVERAGSETVLSQIIETVSEAQRSRAPVQDRVDQIAAWFVPIVLSIALLSALLWLTLGPDPTWKWAVLCASSVLIIACPCALGLATPMSIVVGVGRGALNGVLIRNASALEKLAKTDLIYFDKTGTLTLGKPVFHELKFAPRVEDSQNESDTLAALASMEVLSEHPLASAIVEEAKRRQLTFSPVSDFKSEVGKGISARVGESCFGVGNRSFLQSQGIEVGEELESWIASAQGKGEIILYVAKNQDWLGCVSLKDQIKPKTRETMQALQALGVSVKILSGDQPRTVRAIAEEIGISQYEAGKTPIEKLEVLKAEQRGGRVVMMVGDGINDAPALAASDVSVAMGIGSDIAKNTAQVVLIHGDLVSLPLAIQLGRATHQNIRQNIVLAFVYNMVSIPLAAGALYPFTGWVLNPMIAGLAMSLSSVSVIVNALRLSKERLS